MTLHQFTFIREFMSKGYSRKLKSVPSHTLFTEIALGGGVIIYGELVFLGGALRLECTEVRGHNLSEQK